MTQYGEKGPWGFSGLAFAAVVFAALAVNGVVLWRWSGTDDHVQESSGVAAPEAEQSAEPSPSPPSVSPPSAASKVEYGSRGGEPALSPQGTAGSQPSVQRHGPGASNSPDGRDSASLTALVVPTSEPGRATSGVAAQASDSRAGRPAGSSPGPQSLGVAGALGGGSTPDARGVSPDDGNAPDAKTPAEGSEPDAEPPAEVDPGSDHIPPVLQLLRFDPPVVEAGNVTMLAVHASDDLSGVKSIRGEIRSPNRSALLPFGSSEAGSGGVSTFPITIPRQAESGVWYVSWISLTDGAANPLLIQAPSAAAAPPGGTLTVSSLESDPIPPEVLQVWFDKGVVDGGEKNVITVEARDNSSGVASMMGACHGPSTTSLIWFTCTLNAESGMWKGDIPVPRTADCGEWRISQLAVKDQAGNTALLMSDSPLLANAGFRVSFREDCDATAPTLDAFDLSPTLVSSETATEVLVTATVYDEGSGAVAMTGWFEGPVSAAGQVPKNYFQCRPDPNDPTAPWTGKVLVPRLAAKGIWKVGEIRLEDKAHNVRLYTSADPAVAGRVFEVQ